MNYTEIESKLSAIGQGFGASPRGSSPFRGHNFMTENTVTRRPLRTLPNVWFELSYGQGMTGGYIYGVTFATHKDGHDHDSSQCCHTFEEVEEALENRKHKMKLKEYHVCVGDRGATAHKSADTAHRSAPLTTIHYVEKVMARDADHAIMLAKAQER